VAEGFECSLDCILVLSLLKGKHSDLNPTGAYWAVKLALSLSWEAKDHPVSLTHEVLTARHLLGHSHMATLAGAVAN